jgi:hypothetical protein
MAQLLARMDDGVAELLQVDMHCGYTMLPHMVACWLPC